MILAPRQRSTVVIAFAVSLFLGLALTPPPGDGAAALLQSFQQHQALASLTGLFRTLAVILVVPALAAVGAGISGRGARLFVLGATALYLGSLAGLVVFTQMIFQSSVLVWLPDRSTALIVAEAIQVSLLWQISTIAYLVGLLVGFLLLGASVWRARRGRLIGLAIGSGLLLHITGGDWWVTSLAGAIVLCGGLTALALRFTGSSNA